MPRKHEAAQLHISTNGLWVLRADVLTYLTYKTGNNKHKQLALPRFNALARSAVHERASLTFLPAQFAALPTFLRMSLTRLPAHWRAFDKPCDMLLRALLTFCVAHLPALDRP